MNFKLSVLYQIWLEMIQKNGFSDVLGNIFWIERKQNCSYAQARIISRMFKSWFFSGK